ncbi:hypothetical protein KLP28_12780 [Nocardioidaceae bacterium]|nr:hypothetical protein KLP28_12780 [Nocardioidaceae bacterium]
MSSAPLPRAVRLARPARAGTPRLLLPTRGSRRVARRLTELARALGTTTEQLDLSTAAAAADLDGIEHVHLVGSDRTLGRTPADAADLVEGLAAHHRVTLTLEDLPRERGGPDFVARARAHRRMVQASHGVVVDSAYEQGWLCRLVGSPATGTVVIPPAAAPVERPASPLTRRRGPLVLGVVGEVSADSGHRDVLEAAALLHRTGRAPRGVRVTCLDTSLSASGAPGQRLLEDAVRLGVTVDDTGALDVDALTRACGTVDVPVVPDGSPSRGDAVLDWSRAGRRPLVARHRYSQELASIHPGRATLVSTTESWDGAISRALDSPRSTSVEAPGAVGLGVADAAAAYASFWAQLDRR